MAREGIALIDLVAKYLKHLKKRKLRPTSIETARIKLKRLCRDLGDKKAHSISKQNLEDWMNSRKFNPVNWNNHKRYLNALFAFAIEEKYLSLNPAEKILSMPVEKELPETFTPAQVKKLMHTAEEVYPAIVPYFAVIFFAGLRPDEAQQIKWEHIDFDTGKIKVLAAVAKNRRSRLVSIEDNLEKWLRVYEQEEGLIAPSYITLRRWRKRIYQQARTGWPKDIARHCYASYHLNLYESIEKTILEMGHSGRDVLFENYRGLTTSKAANKYFSILPAELEGSNVIDLPKRKVSS